MQIDYQLLLSDAQAFSSSGASTNYIDLGSIRHVGRGNPMALVFTVDTGADYTTTDETYAFALQTDDNTSFSSAATQVTRTISAASSGLAAGTIHVIPFNFTSERYLRLYATLGGTTPSITITAWVAPMSMISSSEVTYAAGYTV